MKFKIEWEDDTGNTKSLVGDTEFPLEVYGRLRDSEGFNTLLDNWEMGIGGPGIIDLIVDDKEMVVTLDLVEYVEMEDTMPGAIPRQMIADLELGIQSIMKDVKLEGLKNGDPEGDLVILFLSETDSDFVARQIKREDVKRFVKENSLHDIDYALVQGKLIKNFSDDEPEEFAREVEEE
jgi:hypothetical protein